MAFEDFQWHEFVDEVNVTQLVSGLDFARWRVEERHPVLLGATTGLIVDGE
jgi:hypothetical protein